MFIYYSLEQVESTIRGTPLYRGPDFFLVKGVGGFITNRLQPKEGIR